MSQTDAPHQRNRRRMLRAGVSLGTAAPLASLVASSIASPAADNAPKALSRTRPSMEGPFYPSPPPEQASNQLVKLDAQGQPLAHGTRMHLKGRVLDTAGQPIAGAQVEIWQLNGFGRYHHAGDVRDKPLDPAFSGYGRMQTDAQGQFSFQTIRPGWEETRILGMPINLPPHIHFKIAAPGKDMLTTELHLPPTQEPTKRRLLDVFAPIQSAMQPVLTQEGEWLVAHFDFVV